MAEITSQLKKVKKLTVQALFTSTLCLLPSCRMGGLNYKTLCDAAVIKSNPNAEQIARIGSKLELNVAILFSGLHFQKAIICFI